jgi:hypothetical protein
MVKTKAITVTWRHGQITLPAGLRCTPIRGGSTSGKFFLDQFPEDLFPRNSIERHDAVHYGVVLEPDQVEVAP